MLCQTESFQNIVMYELFQQRAHCNFFFIVVICRCQKWVQNTRREDIRSYTPQHLYTNYRICDKHFEDSQFMNRENRKAGIIWCALPTLFDVPNPPPKVTPQRKMRTSSSMPSSEKKRRGKFINYNLHENASSISFMLKRETVVYC